MNTFGEKMKALRKNSEWTQKYTAEKLGVSPQMYNHYEKNKTNPPLEILKRICNLYNINLDSLTGEYDSISDFLTSVELGKSPTKEKFLQYQVIETADITAEQLQAILNKAANEVPEKQIDHVVGTKIILSYVFTG